MRPQAALSDSYFSECPRAAEALLATALPRDTSQVGDKVIAKTCPMVAVSPVEFDGDPEVLIDGRPPAKVGSPTKHSGGAGTIIRSGP